MTNAMTLPTISSTDGLDQYIRLVKSFPMLSAEDEFALATRLQKDNDLEAAKQLILSHMRLVVSIVRKFDPERGVRLVSFAMHWIKAEIHEYIVRNWRLVKIATTKAQRKLFFNLRSMKQGLGTLDTKEVKHIADELNVKPEEVLEMEARMNGHEISLEGYGDDDGEEIYSPIAYLEDPNAEPSEFLAEKQAERLEMSGLAQAMESLDERSRRIVQARWLQEDNSATLHDLADEFGVSAERIRQIEQKAMQKMRLLLSESQA